MTSTTTPAAALDRGQPALPGRDLMWLNVRGQLAAATTRSRQDELLDYWLDLRDRATEWDADQWGLDPDRWCAKERAEMARARTPKETR
ncbi:hypothetical protein [Streptomyces phytophilus]|uniref:hypothetical protein n=1 Tax=Streptomyces phytophilus TaxID=722715 RepID=UPI00215DC2CD|nr:hypothetical protein [Streptomyces phytophilus]